MSSKVKQANFRLPLDSIEYINEVAEQQQITKAHVITRALECLRASLESGNAGKPVKTAPEASSPSEDTAKLQEAITRAQRAERERDAVKTKENELNVTLNTAREKARQAIADREAAEAKAREAQAAREAAEAKVRDLTAKLAAASSFSSPHSNENDEIARLRSRVARQEAILEERKNTLASKDAELAAKSESIRERDRKIASLSEKLGAANARIELAKHANEVQAEPIEDPATTSAESNNAMSVLNMIGGVMGAFQQQVVDARVLGEQEGRDAARRELKDVVERARNDGYRDAMGYLDNRVTTAREAGAKEERARIANMSFFEQRRYLKTHIV